MESPYLIQIILLIFPRKYTAGDGFRVGRSSERIPGTVTRLSQVKPSPPQAKPTSLIKQLVLCPCIHFRDLSMLRILEEMLRIVDEDATDMRVMELQGKWVVLPWR